MKRVVLRRMPAGTSVWERTSFRMLLFGAFSNHLIHRRCTKTARHFGPMNDSAQSPQGRLPNQRSMSGARMNASVKIIRFHRAAEQTKLSAATAAHASLPSSLRRRAISLDERVEHAALADSRGPPPEEAIAPIRCDRITRIHGSAGLVLHGTARNFEPCYQPKFTSRGAR